jgi:DNA-binding Xre family transcriptional regulator
MVTFFSAGIPPCQDVGVDDPRQRARKRMVAFFGSNRGAQTKFAKTIGISQSGVSKMLADGPILERLDQIAAFMGCSPAELLGESDRDLIRHAPPTPSPSTPPEDRDDSTAPAHRLELADALEATAAQLDRLAATLRQQAGTARPARPGRGGHRRAAH